MGIPIVPTRVNSGRSLTIETTGVARRAALLVKSLNYAPACLSVFLSITKHFARLVPMSKRSEWSNTKKESGWDFGPSV